MLPTVFLSLEGSAEGFVAEVRRFLPDGLAYFYPQSFRNGEELISAMEERVGQASIFALFASKKSVASPWVGFEIERARLAAIKNKNFRVLVIPIDLNVAHSDLPAWMRDFWVGRVGNGPREIARYIRKVLITGPLSHLPSAQVFGRGALVDSAVNAVNDRVLRTEQTPNVIVLAGPLGIGRRTLSRRLLANAFPATPELGFGPEFVLPQFADLADLYRELRQEVETDLPFHSIGADTQAFGNAPINEQAREVAHRLAHFANLGQAVTIVTGNGIFDDKGFLKPWVSALFDELSLNRQVKLLVISRRLIHENELRSKPNVLQVQVPPLGEPDIRALMVASTTLLGAKPTLPNNDVVRSIGGHPGIAQAIAALIAQQGPAVLNSNPADLFTLQEEVLGESLDFVDRTPLERDLLSVLSWVPRLASDTLRRVIIDRHGATAIAFGNAVSKLTLACLIEVSGSDYAISGPMRALFRRLHGYGSNELMKAFSAALREEFERARADDKLQTELLDALAFMAAIEGGTLPSEFRNLLLPSTQQQIVKETYDRGHDDPEALRRVIAWGSPALKGQMDETTREEILSYVLRAIVRLRDADFESAAGSLLAFFDERQYRSRAYLRAFYLRVGKNDPGMAVPLLLEARKLRKYMKLVIGDLAHCYQRLGRWSQLQDLVRDQAEHIGRNPVLLDVQAGMFIAQGDWGEADRVIRTLRTLNRQEVYADGRQAMLIMRRDQAFKEAQAMLTGVLQRGSGGQTFIRRLRGVAAAQAGDFRVAREDIEFIKARGAAGGTVGIEARIKLKQGDYTGAERELAKAGTLSGPDELLRARILEARAEDPATAFSDREKLRREVEMIRGRNRMLNEYEIER
ncbi:TIR domain-containing protein [Gluconobacter oxydans]|uniref:TIR domain-containing protein n=1 Tax=Gluconobacter oxydans TaxID=442 RepID=UPI0039EC4361